MESDRTVEVHAIFRGLVQGVFFRAHARRIAQQMGVVGSVSNLPDGTVEIYAQARKAVLEGFLAALTGPDGPGRVYDLSSDYYSPVRGFSSFDIVY